MTTSLSLLFTTTATILEPTVFPRAAAVHATFPGKKNRLSQLFDLGILSENFDLGILPASPSPFPHSLTPFSLYTLSQKSQIKTLIPILSLFSYDRSFQPIKINP